jgi:sugar lactone lactonase YvrE
LSWKKKVFAAGWRYCAAVGVGLALCLPMQSAHADVVYFNTYDIEQVTQGGPPSVFVQATDDGPGGNHIQNPLGIAIDTSGNLYVDSLTDPQIVKIAPDKTTSVFYDPPNALNGIYRGLVVDKSGDVYVATESGSEVDKITPAGVESTVASGLSSPEGLARAADGTLYYEDYHGTITKIAPDGTTSLFSSGLSDGRGGGVAVDASGNVYIAGTSTIYEITPSGMVSTFVTGVTSPYGLAFGSGGDLFVGNGDPSLSLLLVTPTGAISTFASNAGGSDTAVLETPEPSSLFFVGCGLAWFAAQRRTGNSKGSGVFDFGC